MDRVLTVWEYYDGPRKGIAEYGGEPHYFSCVWDDVADDYSSSFSLSPIDGATLSLALEQWQIWRAWEADFHAGRVTSDSHPAFSGKNTRYDELARLVDNAISELPPAEIQASPIFTAAADSSDWPQGGMRPLLVAWSNLT